MSKVYMDYELIKKYPNKYNLTPENIKTLKILDWPRLKQHAWHNQAMDTGNWWCHLEGCNPKGKPYSDYDEFWIGFNERDGKIDCHFSAMEGMCNYVFSEFYTETENKFDLQVQVNAIQYLNMLLDKKILSF